MSRHESDGIGAADPITGVAAGGDDLDEDEQLAAEEVADPSRASGRRGDVDYAADDPEALAAASQGIATNDAVAGETVDPGLGDGNDGPTGGAPAEASPDEPDIELQADGADLDTQNEDAY